MVKWKKLDYEECTWEDVSDVEIPGDVIAKYEANNHPTQPSEGNGDDNCRQGRAKTFTKFTESPKFNNGHTLRSYQLEGLNWLAFSWHREQCCILADEMGLGKRQCLGWAYLH